MRCKLCVYNLQTNVYATVMAIRGVVQQHIQAKVESDRDKHVVSARIASSFHSKLEALAERFGVKKSTLAAELLEAAIEEAWDEADSKTI